MENWVPVVGTVSSIIGTIAAIIAAYYSFKSRPRKVKDLKVAIGEITCLEDKDQWNVNFSFCNAEDSLIAKNGIVVVETDSIDFIKFNPIQDASGRFTVPSVAFENNSFNYSFKNIKPETKQIVSIKLAAKPGDYLLQWRANGENIKKVNGEVELKLKNN
ncbi:hypothetical protein [Halanaerobium kushneri]|uniref:Uncharacterized protein n=1 Tax=Halanaerobium kushneri TaxID=56779 RepID=A0A1N6UXY4_9FIRM|nr:hypothetical protein [Halanaerobium kushneri]SIQ70514.1 hypothetical protein SAMN05421834_10757 [Halanaerobium kushneri]